MTISSITSPLTQQTQTSTPSYTISGSKESMPTSLLLLKPHSRTEDTIESRYHPTFTFSLLILWCTINWTTQAAKVTRYKDKCNGLSSSFLQPLQAISSYSLITYTPVNQYTWTKLGANGIVIIPSSSLKSLLSTMIKLFLKSLAMITLPILDTTMDNFSSLHSSQRASWPKNWRQA